MKLFSTVNNKLKDVSIVSFKSEKEIQTLVEKNIKTLFNLEMVTTEFSVKEFRFDTLCFDNENQSFVIIEYKKDRNSSVIDQGYTYLSVMLNNKSDFILEYNEKFNDKLKKNGDYWSQSKVIFVSQKFTDYQINSINFKDVPFELWEITKHENDIIGLQQYKSKSKESITKVIPDDNKLVGSVSKEVKVYTEESYLNNKNVPKEIKELYFKLRERIQSLVGIEVVPRKSYISFKRNTNVVDIDLQKGNLWLWINLKKGELDDPKKITRDVSKVGHYGNGDYDLKVNSKSDLDYIMFLINQSYKKQD